MRLFSSMIPFAEFQKCIVCYTSIEYFPQHWKFNFCFLKNTKTTVVLFVLSITEHVVVFVSLYCNCWAVIILKYITKIQHTDSAKIQIILPEDKKYMCQWFSCTAIFHGATRVIRELGAIKSTGILWDVLLLPGRSVIWGWSGR